MTERRPPRRTHLVIGHDPPAAVQHKQPMQRGRVVISAPPKKRTAPPPDDDDENAEEYAVIIQDPEDARGAPFPGVVLSIVAGSEGEAEGIARVLLRPEYRVRALAVDEAERVLAETFGPLRPAKHGRKP